mgnify:CR=1 FL=1
MATNQTLATLLESGMGGTQVKPERTGATFAGLIGGTPPQTGQIPSIAAGGGPLFNAPSGWPAHPDGTPLLVAYYGMGGVEFYISADSGNYYLEIKMGESNQGYSEMTEQNFIAGFGGVGAASNIQNGDVIKYQTGTTLGYSSDGWNFDVECIAESNPASGRSYPTWDHGPSGTGRSISLKLPGGYEPNSYLEYWQAFDAYLNSGPPSGFSWYDPSEGFGLASTGSAAISGWQEGTADTSAYANQAYVDSAINGIKNSAPEAFDTLGEIAAAIPQTTAVQNFLRIAGDQRKWVFIGNGSTTDYSVNHAAGNVDVYVDGVLQTPELKNSASGSTDVLSGYAYRSKDAFVNSYVTTSGNAADTVAFEVAPAVDQVIIVKTY